MKPENKNLKKNDPNEGKEIFDFDLLAEAMVIYEETLESDYNSPKK